MTPPRRLTCTGLLVALLVVRSAAAQRSPPALQNKAGAQALFNRGLADMEAGRYEQACPIFAESLRFYRAPGTLFTLAECEAKRGRIATAVARYDEYLALYETLSPTRKAAQGTRAKDAQAQLAALAPTVPELTLALPSSAPSGTRVSWDGQEIPGARLGTPMPIDPGDHVLRTEVPGKTVTERRVTLLRGEKRKVELEVERPPPAPSALPQVPAGEPAASAQPRTTSPTPPDAAPGGRRAGAYVTGGVGLAGVAFGGITGGLTLAARGVANANCKDGMEGVKLCTPEGMEAGNRSKMLGLVSTIGFGAGLAGLGAAAILLLTGPSSPKQAAARGPARAAEPRWWVSAGAQPNEHGGAMLRIQGVW